MSRLVKILKLVIKKLRNRPDDFYFLDKDSNGNYTYNNEVVKAESVHNEIQLSYMTLHDMLPHAIRGAMTVLTHLDCVPANAVYVDQSRFKRISEYHGVVPIQPLKADIS